MNSDIDLARSAVDHLNRCDMRIKLFPLAAPVGTNLFFPDDTSALRCLRPADALSHQRQCTVDVPLVKSRVDLGNERLCVCHTVLRCGSFSLHDYDRSSETQFAEVGCAQPQSVSVRFLTFGV